MQLLVSCIGFAVLKKNLSLLEGLEFTPAASATTKGAIYVPGTVDKGVRAAGAGRRGVDPRQ